jgi:hypothetical protein
LLKNNSTQQEAGDPMAPNEDIRKFATGFLHARSCVDFIMKMLVKKDFVDDDQAVQC